MGILDIQKNEPGTISYWVPQKLSPKLFFLGLICVKKHQRFAVVSQFYFAETPIWYIRFYPIAANRVAGF